MLIQILLAEMYNVVTGRHEASFVFKNGIGTFLPKMFTIKKEKKKLICNSSPWVGEGGRDASKKENCLMKKDSDNH